MRSMGMGSSTPFEGYDVLSWPPAMYDVPIFAPGVTSDTVLRTTVNAAKVNITVVATTESTRVAPCSIILSLWRHFRLFQSTALQFTHRELEVVSSRDNPRLRDEI